MNPRLVFSVLFCFATVFFILFQWGMVVLFNAPVANCSETTGIVTEFSVGDAYAPLRWKWIHWSYNYTVLNETFVVSETLGRVNEDAVGFFAEKYSPVGKQIKVDYESDNPSVLSDCTAFVAPLSSVFLGICATFAYISFVFLLCGWLHSKKQLYTVLPS